MTDWRALLPWLAPLPQNVQIEATPRGFRFSRNGRFAEVTMDTMVGLALDNLSMPRALLDRMIERDKA